MPDIECYTFKSEYLQHFIEEVFKHYGVPEADAQLASDVLITSDLRGIDSHGVARLHTYFGLLKAGRINPKPKIKILREKASVATVDGDNGLGLVIGPKANAIAMEKAEKVGSGWVSVCHTNHFGIAGYYPLQALKRDLIGWAMTNTTKIVAPLWGMERMLGTNPIAIAFPGLKEPPIVIDLATSVAAFGKVEIAKREQKTMPRGWCINDRGLETIYADEMIEGGALLPLGTDRERGGHKGYALSAMVDILSAVLSGANWGPFAPPFTLQQSMPERSVGKGIGHFFGAMQIDGFIEVDEFKRQIDDWIQTFRQTKAAPGTSGTIIPGDPERKAEQIRGEQGIPLLQPVIIDLLDISRQSGIPFKLNKAN
ncbi:Ldh family oxidoreductase [Catalinimonas niigatensis]|uniref:Ldh family oxidoreductase n=1 Tax=Catalinimonas niigatensis TaxID=1397264 RepID=UPI00266581F2|nr:Ldh family oxidoreductase [Catalinimonas niigatensis]WPP52464.1 Ldh family oxidoreductase [Catalinimonas niigatensis]